MATDLTICNDALIAVGHAQISALTEATQAARLCSRLYPLRRDELLRAFDWDCARALAALAALDTPPLFGADYQYQLPNDCLTVRATDHDSDNPEDPVEWRVDGTLLLTDLGPPLNIVYTRQLPDASLMDPDFTAALALRIAVDLAMPLSNNASLRQELRSDYQAAISQARGSSYREALVPPLPDLWLWARR